MKAMVLEQYNAPLQLRDLDIPRVGAGDILVRMKACSVCNSDNKLKSGQIDTVRLPVIPGHEPAGEVVETGKNVTQVKVGDRVTFLHYTSCGQCKNCRRGRSNACLVSFKRLGYELNGGFAEYMVAPADNALVVPAAISYEEAALIPDAICTSVHAFTDRAPVQCGDSVLIMGLGGLGIHGMQVAKAFGALVLAADIDNRKLALAQKLGADHVINPQKEDLVTACRELTGGFGVDIAAEFVGISETSELALACVAIGGTMVTVGYAPGTTYRVPSTDICMGEKTIIGSKSRLKKNLYQGLQLVLDGKVRPQIEQTFPLEEANVVLDKLAAEGFLGRGVLVMNR